jgi:hypothetical protein
MEGVDVGARTPVVAGPLIASLVVMVLATSCGEDRTVPLDGIYRVSTTGQNAEPWTLTLDRGVLRLRVERVSRPMIVGHYRVGEKLMSVSFAADGSGSTCLEKGIYRWARRGTSLVLTLVHDPCPDRAGLMSGST